MADPKYANLPGIAYDQVDVYETTDLPESEQFQMYPEDETDSIEKLHISAPEAFNKFKGKYVVNKTVDFSDSVSHKPRTGYNFETWEHPGDGDDKEKETPLQRAKRLQFELEELSEELKQLKDKPTDTEELNATNDIMRQINTMFQQMASFSEGTEDSLTDVVSRLSDPQGTGLKELISKIESFKQTSIPTSESEVKEEDSKAEETTEAGVLKYQMMYLPKKARMQEAARIAVLEQRLCNLENIIGTSNDKYSKFSQNLKCQGVMEAVQQLGAKASLLDASQLDNIENRLATLIYRMDNISQKQSALSVSSELERQITEMYDIMKKTESMSEILPQTVNRMLALNTVHQRAAEFAKSLTQLEDLQTQITSNLESNKTMLKGVQESFASNLEIIKNNISSLDERIQKLDK